MSLSCMSTGTQHPSPFPQLVDLLTCRLADQLTRTPYPRGPIRPLFAFINKSAKSNRSFDYHRGEASRQLTTVNCELVFCDLPAC